MNKDEILELTKYSEEELKEQIKSTKTYVKVIIDIILKLDERLNKYKLKIDILKWNFLNDLCWIVYVNLTQANAI